MEAPRCFGELQLLEDDDARTLAHDEAVAILVERAAGLLRLVVARREGAHRRKPAHAHRGDGRLRPARNHHVGIVTLDDLERVADGMRRGRARGAGRRVGPLGTVADGDLAGGEVDDGGGNEERRDPARAALDEGQVLALDGAEAADARGDEHADAGRDVLGHRHRRIVHGVLGRGDRELDEDVHLLDVFLVDELQRIEVLDLARDARGELRGVEVRDRTDAGTPGQQRVPVCLGADAEW